MLGLAKRVGARSVFIMPLIRASCEKQNYRIYFELQDFVDIHL
jgi:hypothetical protein